MKIKVPFDYITMLAFETLLKYENKRSIKLDILQKYHETLLEEVVKDYHNPNSIYFADADQWEGEIEFELSLEDNIDHFLNKYKQFFYAKEDTIYLYRDITFEEIKQEEIALEEEQNIGCRFLSVSDHKALFELLNINRIKNLIKRHVKVEEKIEKMYHQLSTDDSDKVKQKLKKLLFMRAIFLHNISQNPQYVIDAFRLEVMRVQDEDTCEYQKLPVNLDLWKNSSYVESDDLGSDIFDRFYDIFQYAIFGKASIAANKTNELLQNLYFFEDNPNMESSTEQDELSELDEFPELDEFSEIDDSFDLERCYYLVDNQESDLVFYLLYLRKLDEYMMKYGSTKDLIETRQRLIYALDLSKLCLFEPDNLTTEYEKARELDLDPDEFGFVEEEIEFMADEVFVSEKDENTLKKLLFVSTYYDLTKDEEIVSIFNRHFDYPGFNNYSAIVFGDGKDFSKKLGR